MLGVVKVVIIYSPTTRNTCNYAQLRVTTRNYARLRVTTRNKFTCAKIMLDGVMFTSAAGGAGACQSVEGGLDVEC